MQVLRTALLALCILTLAHVAIGVELKATLHIPILTPFSTYAEEERFKQEPAAQPSPAPATEAEAVKEKAPAPSPEGTSNSSTVKTNSTATSGNTTATTGNATGSPVSVNGTQSNATIVSTNNTDVEKPIEMDPSTTALPFSEAPKEFNDCFQWKIPKPTQDAAGAALGEDGSPVQPSPRSGHITWLDETGRNMYLFGGCTSADATQCMADFYALDVKTGLWRKIEIHNSNDPRSTMQMRGESWVYDNNTRSVFIFGGNRVDKAGGFSLSNKLTILSRSPAEGPEMWVWETLAIAGTSPPPRQDASMSIANGNLVLFGGFSDLGFPTDVWSMNIKVAKEHYLWVEHNVTGYPVEGRKGASASVVPIPASSLALVEEKNKRAVTNANPEAKIFKIYYFGGSNGEKSLDDIIELTLGDTDDKWTWQSINMTGQDRRAKPVARAFHSATIYDNRIFIIAGCDYHKLQCFDDLHVFDVPSLSWILPAKVIPLVMPREAGSEQPGRPSPAGKMSSVVTPDKKMMLMGGCSRGACYKDIWTLDLEGACPDSCGQFGNFSESEGKCICVGDHYGKTCSEHATCPDDCHTDKKAGLCVEKDHYHFCQCHNGFWGQNCGNPACLGNCTGNGVCFEEGKCRCRPGYSGSDCSVSAVTPAPQTNQCLFHCSGQGNCNNDLVCECPRKFGGNFCEKGCPRNCNDHGKCNRKGECECDQGYTGAACEKTFCALECSSRGKCIAEKCECDVGFVGAFCEIDATCNGNGKYKNGVCECQPSFAPPDCSQKIVCPEECNGHGECLQPLSLVKSLEARQAAIKGAMEAEVKEDKPASSFLQMQSSPGRWANPHARFLEIFQSNSTVEGVCKCSPAWGGKACGDKVCPNECSGQGICTERSLGNAGGCTCFPGYDGLGCEKTIRCPGNCTSVNHGSCQTNGFCACKEGWTGKDCYTQRCPKDCSGHGVCREGQCHCDDAFSGADCSVSCPNSCTDADHGLCVKGACICTPFYEGEDCSIPKKCPFGSNEKECGGRGFCFRPEATCLCEPGYTGTTCEQGSGECGPEDCSGRGQCVEGECICDLGYRGEHCTIKAVCPRDCMKHGYCDEDRCLCQPGWEGEDCSKPKSDPGCANNCTNHGICDDDVCVCFDGYGGDECEKVINFCDSNACSGKGTCLFEKCFCEPGYKGRFCADEVECEQCVENQGVCMKGVCKCLPGFSGSDCSARATCPGQPDVGECSNHGICSLGRCQCEPGYESADCSVITVKEGLTCPGNCSASGFCLLGKCFCEPGRSGDDCATEDLSVCPNDCTGRGVCRGGVCFCDGPYTGEACQFERQCSRSCLDNGICVGGKCMCRAGWTGEHCHKLANATDTMKALEADLIATMKLEKQPCEGLDFCNFHGVCLNETCACLPGFEGGSCENRENSRPACGKQTCINGQCLFDMCFCHVGFTGPECKQPLADKCPNDCSGHGVCRSGKCECDQSHTGLDCADPKKCDKCNEEGGVCRFGECLCIAGFGGLHCEKGVEPAPAPEAVEAPPAPAPVPNATNSSIPLVGSKTATLENLSIIKSIEEKPLVYGLKVPHNATKTIKELEGWKPPTDEERAAAEASAVTPITAEQKSKLDEALAAEKADAAAAETKAASEVATQEKEQEAAAAAEGGEQFLEVPQESLPAHVYKFPVSPLWFGVLAFFSGVIFSSLSRLLVGSNNKRGDHQPTPTHLYS